VWLDRYGQTNCFVLPEGDYGAYEWADPVGILIMSARSARGASLPHLHRDWAHPCYVCTGTGLTPPAHLHGDWAHEFGRIEFGNS
jgi:hypothetical protein